MEKKEKLFEIPDVPLNLNVKIGEGSSANIYKYVLRNKLAAVKCFKTNIPKYDILRVASHMRRLRHQNKVRFRGYSVRPASIFLEFCSVKINNKVLHNIFELTNILNTSNYFELKERIGYVFQTLSGLKYLHDNDVLHKDLKLTNLLVQGSNSKDVVVKTLTKC